MDGPQHYREAEALLHSAGLVDVNDASLLIAVAQVHATLALAAATARPGLAAMDWEEVTR